MAVKRKSPRSTRAAKTASPNLRRVARAKPARPTKSAVTAQSSGARTEYRIYPSIGIARVGDSKDGFIIGPEAPGVAPARVVPRQGDRGSSHRARFRVFQVDIDRTGQNGQSPSNWRTGRQIRWTVQLANEKQLPGRSLATAARTLTRNNAARISQRRLRPRQAGHRVSGFTIQERRRGSNRSNDQFDCLREGQKVHHPRR